MLAAHGAGLVACVDKRHHHSVLVVPQVRAPVWRLTGGLTAVHTAPSGRLSEANTSVAGVVGEHLPQKGFAFGQQTGVLWLWRAWRLRCVAMPTKCTAGAGVGCVYCWARHTPTPPPSRFC
jgi:hypothetical protein